MSEIILEIFLASFGCQYGQVQRIGWQLVIHLSHVKWIGLCTRLPNEYLSNSWKAMESTFTFTYSKISQGAWNLGTIQYLSYRSKALMIRSSLTFVFWCRKTGPSVLFFWQLHISNKIIIFSGFDSGVRIFLGRIGEGQSFVSSGTADTEIIMHRIKTP